MNAKQAYETIPSMAGFADGALGLYISIPFCRSKCTWCNFASGVYPASSHARYIDRVLEDMAAAPAYAQRMGVQLPSRVDTVYLGGGTPSVLAPEQISRLFAAIRRQFQLDPDAEITVECAPGQIADPTLEALVQAGVNRVSLGVQSFVDREAQVSGRLHNRAIVEADIARLRQAGLANLSVDLIAGLAHQTHASWDESLDALIASGVPHASVYMLEVDEDSRLGRELLSGGARYHAGLVPSDEAIAQMYPHAIRRLAAAGLSQYEISNFARPGMASQHNLRYWQRRPYLGLGLDASSMLRAVDPESASEGAEPPHVLRTTTTDALPAYLAADEPPETAWLSPARQLEEAWFLGLRLNAGVPVAALQREFGKAAVAPALEVAARLQDEGLLTSTAEASREADGESIRLTPQGQLFSNDVFQEFLTLDAQPAHQ